MKVVRPCPAAPRSTSITPRMSSMLCGCSIVFPPLHSRPMTRSLLLLCALAVSGCDARQASPPHLATAASSSFDEWADTFTKEWTRTSPQLATRTQYFTGDEQDALDRQLSMVGE